MADGADVEEDLTSRWESTASQAQLRAVIENIDEGLVIADSGGSIITINQRAREMIGYPPVDPDRRTYHIADFPRYLEMRTVDGRELASSERPMARVMAGERFGDYELVCRQLRTGKEWVASFVGTPVLAADGEVELAVLSARDITERRRVEEMLRAASRQKDDFIAALAHELRNPLAPILTGAELLQRGQIEAARQRSLAATIARQAGHLAAIVDDLLDVSRITSGRIVLDTQTLDVASLVRETTEDYGSAFEAAGVEAAVSTGSAPLWVRGDRVRLAQIVENLLSNAVKFTDRGGRVEVVVRSADDGRSAQIVVADTGVGVEPSLLQTLWEPFSQGSRPPRNGVRGLGLGTSLIRGLAELHGGSVEVVSAGRGRGSEFIVTLPSAPAPAGAAVEAVPPAAPPRGMKVLVIEDNEDVSSVLTAALDALGCRTKAVADGVEGVEVARTWQPAIVLCDIGLPGAWDGYEVAEALRSGGFAGTLVALTGFGQPEDRRRAIDAGFDDHATKPLSMDALAGLVSGAAGAEGPD